MNHEIVEIITDMGGKYMVRVIIDENTTEFFRFDAIPSQEEVNEVVENYLKSKAPIIDNL